MNQYTRVDRCPIDIYVASNMPYEYPYKLVKPEHVSADIVESAETVIMDSGIGNQDMTNQKVLDLSDRYDTDFVVGKDYLHEQEDTTESVRKFLELYDAHPTRATPLIPLQPEHAEHYKDLRGEYAYLLGGMAFNVDTRTIIDAVEKFRATAGMAPYVHLLGVGTNPRLMDYLANNPDMVQSIDCSTPEQCAINGKIFDVSLEQVDYQIRTGNGSSDTRAGLARHLAYTLNDAVTMRYENQNQHQLGAFC